MSEEGYVMNTWDLWYVESGEDELHSFQILADEIGFASRVGTILAEANGWSMVAVSHARNQQSGSG